MTSLRVYDKTKNRYGQILTISFRKGKILYGVYDENGDPVEIKPTTVNIADCVLEVKIGGYWCIIDLSQFRAGGKLQAISIFKGEADIDGKTVSLAGAVEVLVGGTWRPLEVAS